MLFFLKKTIEPNRFFSFRSHRNNRDRNIAKFSYPAQISFCLCRKIVIKLNVSCRAFPAWVGFVNGDRTQKLFLSCREIFTVFIPRADLDFIELIENVE